MVEQLRKQTTNLIFDLTSNVKISHTRFHHQHISTLDNVTILHTDKYNISKIRFTDLT